MSKLGLGFWRHTKPTKRVKNPFCKKYNAPDHTLSCKKNRIEKYWIFDEKNEFQRLDFNP